MKRVIFFGAVALMLCAGTVMAAVNLPPDAAEPLRFAAAEIINAGAGKPAIDVLLEVQSNGVPQSYRVERDGVKVRVIGGDAVGAMYGGLDVAESIRLGRVDDLSPAGHKPYIAERGIKFNIPLDLRTPSYSDDSEASRDNMPEVWSRDFWREFFDEMARDRYNVLSLWNDNPFPSIVKVPEFPDVALNDVLRGNPRWYAPSVRMSSISRYTPEMLRDAEVIKKMTIDEKVAFWRDVMQMAKDRGIDVYWFTWNAFLWTEEGKDGMTRKEPFGKMADYFRASVRETVKTYPLLAGMGVTAGENMYDIRGADKERWLWETYGEGIRDALKTETNRQFRLIHRLLLTDTKSILAAWTNYPGPFDFSFKYAVGHMYGMTNPTMIKPYLSSFSPECRTWLTVRNDDIYSFRWADTTFARDFILAMPGPDKLAGFYMGPDGFCWGREFMSLAPEAPRQLVMKKQWLSFTLWGRLSFDPTLPDSLFDRMVAVRFPEAPADELVKAWTTASRIIPEVNRFNWMPNDYQWFPEANWGRPSYRGFYSVRDFMLGSGMPDSGDMTIREWRTRQLAGQPMTGLTPPQVAARMREDAATALAGVAALRPQAGADKELHETLGDIEAMAWLGNYYADKIEGAAELALFDATSQPDHQAAAVKHLESALNCWKEYAADYTKQYKQPILYGRLDYVDIPKLADKAAADIDIAKGWKSGQANAAGNNGN